MIKQQDHLELFFNEPTSRHELAHAKYDEFSTGLFTSWIVIAGNSQRCEMVFSGNSSEYLTSRVFPLRPSPSSSPDPLPVLIMPPGPPIAGSMLCS